MVEDTTSVEVKTRFNRFKDAPWLPKEDTFVLIGGAGGIGSWLTLLLARAGFKPVVHDFDTLEEHNLGGQLYPKSSIGKSKVEALEEVCKNFADEVITAFEEKIDKNSASHNFCFSAFDNMEAREAMFESWVKQFGKKEGSVFIDGRLTAEQMQIFCVRGGKGNRIDEYRQMHLFGDSEVEDAPCTFKQTSHAAAMIAAHMTGFFTNHYTNVVEKDNTRSVPFYWEYFIPMDLLTQND